MDIDIRALRAGRKEKCPECQEGYFKQAHEGMPSERETLFICSNCGKDLYINYDLGWKKILKELTDSQA